ncbi:MAG: hypothetical protein M5T61_04995 [Acidimicrobiia bacterium]|nr:hypothetical protein [Acidimicrobiia bacterium]
MSPLRSADFGIDPDRIGEAEPIARALSRRLGGRYPVDPFGFDPMLADLATPVARALVRVRTEGADRIPETGPAVFVANRGLGIGEPMALGVAVGEMVGRRLRVVGAPGVPFVNGLVRRLGSVHASPEDLAACLRAGHLVAVPLGPTWLRTGAGSPPLELCAAMMGFTVYPVAVTPGGPLGAPIRPWRVRIGPHIELDDTYAPGDPLGAAELGDAMRRAVEEMLAGRAAAP